MQLKEALEQGVELLEKAAVPSPRITAEVLLMHAAVCDRAYLHAHSERELSDSERVHYGRYLNERLQGKPTQYITGQQEFWGMEFLVNPSVLIPRPETELVVEAALELARFSTEQGIQIADVGTGSGCIAIALAKELSGASIFALDSSPEALETARRNAQRLGVEKGIAFLRSDLLRPCDAEALPELHMVVSNPPYVAERDRKNIEREVRDFEPRDALFAGESGGGIYSRLIPQVAQVIRAGGCLVLELGYDSEGYVRSLLQPPAWEELRWLTDLAGIVRVVTARRAPAVGENT